MSVILAGTKLTPARLNNISPYYRAAIIADQVSTGHNTTLFNITGLVKSFNSGVEQSPGDWQFWGIDATNTPSFGTATNGAIGGLGVSTPPRPATSPSSAALSWTCSP